MSNFYFQPRASPMACWLTAYMISSLGYLEIPWSKLGQIELIFSPKPVLVRFFSVNATSILVIAQTKSFGIVLDSPSLPYTHGWSISKFFQSIFRVWPFLSASTSVTLVLSTRISCLDHHSSLLSGLPVPHSLFLTCIHRDAVNICIRSHSFPAQYPPMAPSEREQMPKFSPWPAKPSLHDLCYCSDISCSSLCSLVLPHRPQSRCTCCSLYLEHFSR